MLHRLVPILAGMCLVAASARSQEPPPAVDDPLLGRPAGAWLMSGPFHTTFSARSDGTIAGIFTVVPRRIMHLVFFGN